MRGRHGFTLVEVLVILVILAVLAAVLLPSLTGYIDRAREQSAVSRARSAYAAVQTLLTERYGMQGVLDPLPEAVWIREFRFDPFGVTPLKLSDVLALAQIDDPAGDRGILLDYDEHAAIRTFVWQETVNGSPLYVSLQPGGSWRTSRTLPEG